MVTAVTVAQSIQSPSQATYWFIQGRILFLIIHLLARRVSPTSWAGASPPSFGASVIGASTNHWLAWETY